MENSGMKVSCGIIIETRDGWLLGHSTGGKHWDFPKGVADDGENHEDAAFRELKEETGLELALPKVFNFRDLGEHSYKPTKRLHMFYAFYTMPIDPAKLVCTSMVERPGGRSFPELDKFAIVPADVALTLLSKRMREWVLANVPETLRASPFSPPKENAR
jgi:8-oxo-dGTP pyrophosphatase MutT (NUDIX family)